MRETWAAMIGSAEIAIGIPALSLAPGDHGCAFDRAASDRNEIFAASRR